MKLVGESQDYVHGGTQKDVYTEDETQSVPCPLCGERESTRLYTEHEVVGIVQCRRCDLIYTSPRLRSPEQVYWGDEETYFSEARLIFEGRQNHHRDPNYLSEIQQIEAFKKSGRFLDVGCNMGRLLSLARDRGWEVTGVEPSPSLASIARRWGYPVHNCFLDQVPRNELASFDVVALSDVFEHITNPKDFLDSACRMLKPDGVLYVKVPNARWSLFKQRCLETLGRRPSQGLWDSYEHVVHYTDRTLTRMLEECGLTVLRIATERPVQTPNWHEHVGHYYQYPTPWFMDAGRKLVRSGFYWLAGLERALRFGSLGSFAQNVVAIARLAHDPS